MIHAPSFNKLCKSALKDRLMTCTRPSEPDVIWFTNAHWAIKLDKSDVPPAWRYMIPSGEWSGVRVEYNKGPMGFSCPDVWGCLPSGSLHPLFFSELVQVHPTSGDIQLAAVNGEIAGFNREYVDLIIKTLGRPINWQAQDTTSAAKIIGHDGDCLGIIMPMLVSPETVGGPLAVSVPSRQEVEA